jgi:septal ring factor EnvC (AmiA/AmiB activator)
LNEKELLQLKKEIEEAKSSISKLEGQKEYLEKELLVNFNCTSVEDAEKLLGKFQKEVEKIEKQIEEGLEELKEAYEFD